MKQVIYKYSKEEMCDDKAILYLSNDAILEFYSNYNEPHSDMTPDNSIEPPTVYLYEKI